MKNQKYSNHEVALNEIVFEGRNKDYGAYDLRMHAGEYMNKALFAGVLLFGSVIGASLLYMNLNKKEIVNIPQDKVHEITLIPEKKDVEKPVDPVKPKAQEAPKVKETVPVKTYDARLPEPSSKVTKEITSAKPPVDASPGIKDTEGVPKPNTYVPPKVENVGPETVPGPETKVPVDKGPYTTVDVEAKFASGLDGFREKIRSGFDTGAMDGTEGTVRAMVTFIVEKDGSISNIKAEGANKDFNNEAIRTIKAIKGRWTPAKVQDQVVRSYFRIPITMNFEQ